MKFFQPILSAQNYQAEKNSQTAQNNFEHPGENF
jgi:hypothetical protein